MFQSSVRTATPPKLRQRLGVLAFAVALVMVMLWPSLLNGGVFIFPDTSAYVRGADAATVKLTGVQSDWSNELFSRYAATVESVAIPSGSPAQSATDESEIVLAGRSIYYGFFLFISDAIAGFWLAAVVQGLLVVSAILLAVRRVTGKLRGTTALGLLALPLVTSVAFYVSFMMPDIFAALAILAAAMTAVYWRELPRGERIFWSVLLLFALCAHSANLIIIGGIVVVAAVVRVSAISRAINPAPAAVMLALAVLAEVSFGIGVARATGNFPVRPPFLSARLVDDGPGHAFLLKSCAKSRPFVLCNYIDRMPALSDEMLWSPNSVRGIFSAVTPDEKRRIAADEGAFVIAVLVDRPFDVLASTARSTARQAQQFGLMEFADRHVDPLKLPARVRGKYIASRAATTGFDVRWSETLMLISFILAAAFVVVMMALQARRGKLENDGCIALTIALGLAFNILVSGALSTPHDRYQSRASWLLPLAALLMIRHKNRSEIVQMSITSKPLPGCPASQSA